MAHIERLKPWILKWEGGFVDHPLDKGGPTNKGVTIGTFRTFYGKNATVEQLKNITDRQWDKIFEVGYWRPFKADLIKSQAVANICVDWAWASGTATAIKQVQRVLGVTADGVVGEVTLGAINRAEPRELFERIKAERTAFVEAIVKRTPSQKVFLKGWKNRINDIKYE